MGGVPSCKCNKGQENNELDLKKELDENKKKRAIENTNQISEMNNKLDDYIENTKNGNSTINDDVHIVRAEIIENSTSKTIFHRKQFSSEIKIDLNEDNLNRNDILSIANSSNGFNSNNRNKRFPLIGNNFPTGNKPPLEIINEINHDVDSFRDSKSAFFYKGNSDNIVNTDNDNDHENDPNNEEVNNDNNNSLNNRYVNNFTSEFNNNILNSNNDYSSIYPQKQNGNVTFSYKNNTDSNNFNSNNYTIDNQTNSFIKNKEDEEKTITNLSYKTINEQTMNNKNKMKNNVDKNKKKVLRVNNDNITSIIPEAKLLNCEEDEVLFTSDLKKLINNEITSHSTQLYSTRFCLITKIEFRYYKSREQYLTLQKPLCIIPFFQIAESNLIKSKTNSKEVPQFYIRVIDTEKLYIDSMQLEKKNYKFLSMDFDSTNQNESTLMKTKKMSLLENSNFHHNNSQIHTNKKPAIEENVGNNLLNYKNLQIFGSDKVDLVNKWITVLNYFINK